MHSTIRSIVALAVALTVGGAGALVASEAQAQAPEAKKVPVPTGEEKDKTLYAIGTLMARQLRPLTLDEAEFAHVVQGLRDATLSGELALKTSDYRDQINAFTEDRNRVASAREAEEAKKFLAAAGKEKGAVTTPSGLVYRELEAGSGEAPGPEDAVIVHYHGSLRDGTVFDSTVVRGQPVEFSLNRVIKCWTEGLQRIKPGGKGHLTCPSEMAYGTRGVPPHIPPNAALAFEVELIEVKGQ